MSYVVIAYMNVYFIVNASETNSHCFHSRSR